MKLKKYSVLKRDVVFSKGPIHLVDCQVRMPDGKVLSRQIIEHPGAVVMIPKFNSRKYILIRQFRFAAKDWLWEWPAGGIEKGENLRSAAERELMEECGFFPKKLKLLLEFYPTPGISSEIMHLFLAENLVPRTSPPDEDEDIELGYFTLPEIGRMIRRNKICDAKTILGYHILKSTVK